MPEIEPATYIFEVGHGTNEAMGAKMFSYCYTIKLDFFSVSESYAT